MKHRQLFLLGSGRSGTTLIQRIFNSFDDVILWGEHSGFLEELSAVYFQIKNCPSMHEYSYSQLAPEDCENHWEYYKNPKRWQAWNNWFGPDDLKKQFRELVEGIFNPEHMGKTRVWGFKEIRYGENPKVIEFLSELYPDAQFLIVARDGLNVIESQLVTFHQGTSNYPRIKRIIQLPILIKIARKWAKMNSTFIQLQKNHPNCKLMKYENFIADNSIMDDVTDKLDLKMTDTQFDILQLKEGRGTSFNPNSNENNRWKNMGFIPAFISEMIIGKTCIDLGYERPKRLSLATKISVFFQK
jgi:hypothetical protein